MSAEDGAVSKCYYVSKNYQVQRGWVTTISFFADLSDFETLHFNSLAA